jgi:hypothetical protein
MDLITFKLWIESQFLTGMTWNNYAYRGWHIDHIHPLCKCDLTNEIEIKKAWNYSNLRPMWGIDNIAKGSKIILPNKLDSQIVHP